MRRIPQITSKTLEFPYGSLSGSDRFRHARSDKNGPNPSLNQPKSDSFSRPGNMLFSVISRLDGVCTEKGPLIAGFRQKVARISIIGPFDNNARIHAIQGDPGPSNRVKSSQKQSNPGQKRPNTVHLRPKGSWRPWPQGTWIYPTLAPDGLGLALATGLRWPKIQ